MSFSYVLRTEIIYSSFINGMLLTALFHSLMIRAQPPHINDKQTNQQNSPQFYGQILMEPLKPRIGNDVSLFCPIKNLGKFNMNWQFLEKTTLLVVQNYVITSDSRIYAKKIYKGDNPYWGLIIKNISMSDIGYYVCQITTTPPQRLLKFLDIFVPMEFDSNQSFKSDSVITVRESENVSITCKASGVPKPRIIWRKQDGVIVLESRSNQFTESVESEELNLQEVSRSAIGDYICIASNDVDNSISRKLTLQVLFPPTIKVPNKVVNAFVNKNITLECITESNPMAQHLWIDKSGHRIDSKLFSKYSLSIIPINSYKMHFKLIIIDLKVKDSGKYACLSTNTLGATKSSISLIVNDFGMDTTTPFTTIETYLTNNTNDLIEEISPESHMDYSDKHIKVYSNINKNNSNQIILINGLHLILFIIHFILNVY